MSDSELTVVNLVASGELGIGEIDTDQLAHDIQVSDYTSQSGRLYLRPKKHPTITIYRSGKFTVAGSRSLQEVESSILWLKTSLEELGIQISKSRVNGSVSVEFMVLQGDLGIHIDLEEVLETLTGRTEYEPEQFPAIIYHPNFDDCTVTIFSTGKVSITGVRRQDQAENVYDHLKSTLTP
jgi:transcription initiation factor TFIID TATA-box-binding protein